MRLGSEFGFSNQSVEETVSGDERELAGALFPIMVKHFLRTLKLYDPSVLSTA